MEKQLLSPAEAIKAVKKRRKTAFYVSAEINFITEETEEGTKVYPMIQNIKITRKQAMKILRDFKDFNSLKFRSNKPTGKIRVTTSKYCLFLG